MGGAFGDGKLADNGWQQGGLSMRVGSCQEILRRVVLDGYACLSSHICEVCAERAADKVSRGNWALYLREAQKFNAFAIFSEVSQCLLGSY